VTAGTETVTSSLESSVSAKENIGEANPVVNRMTVNNAAAVFLIKPSLSFSLFIGQNISIRYYYTPERSSLHIKVAYFTVLSPNLYGMNRETDNLTG
jgi:hypothetical protein